MTDRVTGGGEVLANLNRQILEIEGRTLGGLLQAGLHLEGRAKALAPVLTGNLRGSGYTRKAGDLAVEVGFSASYAIYVHEDLDARHTNGQAKFLEQPAREDAGLMLGMIAAAAKIGVRT